MKTCYVGVGGIGMRCLRELEEKNEGEGRFIYVDSVPTELNFVTSGQKFALTNQICGCHHRAVGKDEIKTLIYNGRMPDFIDDFFLAEDLELVFVTTTFGGFGSAVVFEMSDYYSVRIKNYRLGRGVTAPFCCKVLAYPLQSFEHMTKYASRSLLQEYATSEVEFINEFRVKEARKDAWYQAQSNSIPCVELFVPSAPSNVELCSLIGLSSEQLSAMDIKSKFYYSPASVKGKADVFISYSSKNQEIADMLVSEAGKQNISCWIASESIEAGSYAKQIVQGIREARVFVVIVSEDAIASPHVKNELDIATGRIREGLMIMPFKIDDSDLDDECRYYLGRQEFFFGKNPPMEEKIAGFVEKIKAVLNK